MFSLLFKIFRFEAFIKDEREIFARIFSKNKIRKTDFCGPGAAARILNSNIRRENLIESEKSQKKSCLKISPKYQSECRVNKIPAKLKSEENVRETFPIISFSFLLHSRFEAFLWCELKINIYN